MPEYNFHQRVWWLLRWARWSWGWNTRHTWPEKTYLYVGFDYYDGLLWALHIGPLWVCADEFSDVHPA